MTLVGVLGQLVGPTWPRGPGAPAFGEVGAAAAREPCRSAPGLAHSTRGARGGGDAGARSGEEDVGTALPAEMLGCNVVTSEFRRMWC